MLLKLRNHLETTKPQAESAGPAGDNRDPIMSSLVEEATVSHSMILERMPQQPALLGSMDDWTGIASAAERRKVQNRLNQRLYRKRRRNGATKRPRSEPQATQNIACDPNTNATSWSQSKTEYQGPSLWQNFHSAIESRVVDRAKLVTVAKSCPFGPNAIEMAKSEFEKWMQIRSVGSPRTDNLLTLVKFNIFRALVSNCRVLGIAIHDTLNDDAISPFPETSHPPINPMRVPAALWPTNLQKELIHHPWIDTLPIPRMRDNLLQAEHAYDEEELCNDLIGSGGSAFGRMGLIIWGEPWDPAGWEVTEHFLQHWAWTIRGCHQLANATNSWRQRRGEIPLDFEGTTCESVPDWQI